MYDTVHQMSRLDTAAAVMEKDDVPAAILLRYEKLLMHVSQQAICQRQEVKRLEKLLHMQQQSLSSIHGSPSGSLMTPRAEWAMTPHAPLAARPMGGPSYRLDRHCQTTAAVYSNSPQLSSIAAGSPNNSTIPGINMTPGEKTVQEGDTPNLQTESMIYGLTPASGVSRPSSNTTTVSQSFTPDQDPMEYLLSAFTPPSLPPAKQATPMAQSLTAARELFPLSSLYKDETEDDDCTVYRSYMERPLSNGSAAVKGTGASPLAVPNQFYADGTSTSSPSNYSTSSASDDVERLIQLFKRIHATESGAKCEGVE